MEPFELHAFSDFISPPGDTALFVATSDYALDNHRWFWQPADTLPEAAGRPAWPNVFCRSGTEANRCYTPLTESGRMYLEARVEGGSAPVRHSQIVWVRDSVPDFCGSGGASGAPSATSGPSGTEGPVCPPGEDPGEDADSLVVSLTLSRSEVMPVLDRDFNAATQFWSDPYIGQRTDTIVVSVSARFEPSGTPAAGAAVQLSVEPVDGSGGHAKPHPPSSQAADRPPGRWFRLGEVGDSLFEKKQFEHRKTLSLVTDTNGAAVAVYRSSGVGGREGLTAGVTTGALAAEASDTLLVEFPGLVQVPRIGAGYAFEPAANNSHGPDENYLVDGAIEILEGIWATYLQCHQLAPSTCPMAGSSFAVTGASLNRGGLFDIFRDWETPHNTHRQGRDVDFDDHGAETGGAAALQQICGLDKFRLEGLKTMCVSEGDHFHVFLGNTHYHRLIPGALP